jgi:drug/metabolite transporter (DMT)-like permease
MSPLAVGFYRFLIAAVILAAFLAFTRRVHAVRTAASGWGFMRYTILGFVGILVFTASFFLGIQFTTAGKASLLVNTNPILIVVLAHFFLKERVNVKIMSWVLLGFGGVFLVIVGGKDLSTLLYSGGFLGDILAFGAGVSWAIFSVAGKKWTLNHEAYTSTSLIIFLGLACMFPLNAATHSLDLSPSAYNLALLLYLGVFTVVAAYFLWMKALMLADASKVGVFQFAIPLVTLLLAAVILGEAVDIWTISGFLLIASSICLTLRWAR